ncbi:MAG: GTP-sensing pleiotropic transcriptional regulator CodY [Lachnospiraceae bacterium]|nr:GTP-sensing pleiotropic transcriptional regulator CodY [Lachnospiraceae bacterium]
MGIELLDKTRKINRLLQNSHSKKIVFGDLCRVLSGTLSSHVLVISRKGKVLGIGAAPEGGPIPKELLFASGDMVGELLNERMLSILSTQENVNLVTLGFSVEDMRGVRAMVSPVFIAGERLGTIFIFQSVRDYDLDDIILCEYAAAVVGLEILQSLREESEEEERKISVVRSAMNTLSYSEQEAIFSIFDELRGREGILVASKVADRVGITRSVIVNALRKFESAGIIESRSSGMKGTYIKITNDCLPEELRKMRE